MVLAMPCAVCNGIIKSRRINTTLMATFATSNSELELAGDNILHMPTKDDLVRAAAKYYSPKAIAFDKARNMDDYVRPDGYIQTADAASLVVARRPTALPKRTAKKRILQPRQWRHRCSRWG
ncbi:hypothetical protein ACFS07_07480 [Undibacterium arcticum]